MTPWPIGALEGESYINLATFRRNGVAVETPVWFVVIGGKLYVFTDGTSAKVKRIRATRKVRVAPCSARGARTGPWREGTGRVVDDPETIAHTYADLERKYGWQMRLLNLGSRLAGRITRRVVLELEV